MMLSASTSTAKPQYVWRPIPANELRPMAVAPTTAPTRQPVVDDEPDMVVRLVAPSPTPTAKPKPKPTAKPKPKPQSVVPPPRTTHAAKGKASWYCKAGVSICHYAYPPGSMVAAACSKLRSAMGPNWRGRRVTVTSGGRTVTVKLVDWCGSKDKLIDLYWEPMRRLGGSGVLPVTVRW